MKNAVLMVRVSSDEQAKGYSLDVQEDSLRRYCQRNDIKVIKLIREDHSAKSFERPEFKKFLEYLKKNKGVLDTMLFTSWDRFSRNTADAYEMIRRLNNLGIQPFAIEQPLDMLIPENKAMLAFYLALPEIENDRRSIKILGGIRGARKAGRWTTTAPIGYKNQRDESNKPIIVPDKNAKYIKYAFEQVAAGRPLIEVRRDISSKGCKVSSTRFSVLLRSPIYKGAIFVPADSNQGSYFTKGIHEPLISEQLYEKVQSVLRGRKQKANRPGSLTRRDELPLRGVLICSNCGAHITGSPSRARNGVRHFYYHCNSCRKERFKANQANEAVENVLKDFCLSKDYKELYKEMLKVALGGSTKEKQKKVEALKAEKVQYECRLDNLQDLLVDKKLAVDEYMYMKSKYEMAKMKVCNEIIDLEYSGDNLEKTIENIMKNIGNLYQLYNSYDIEGKNRLLGSIFPEKLSYDGKKCRTTRINEVMRLALSIDKGFGRIKSLELSENLDISRPVERRGVEINLHYTYNQINKIS